MMFSATDRSGNVTGSWCTTEIPFAGADVPPPTDAAYYAPLAHLRLPPTVRFVAGFAHEDQPLADQLRIRDRIDARLGGPVDIAAPCGLGRRPPAAALANLRRVAELTASTDAASTDAVTVAAPAVGAAID